MTVIAEITIPSEEFDLGRVTQTTEDLRIELERVVPMGEGVMPFFWATGGTPDDFDAFERHVRENELVEDLSALARVDDRVLYQVVWGDIAESLTTVLARCHATILEARGNGHWFFRLRFRDHKGLTEFHNLATEADIGFHVERIYTVDEEYGAKYNLDLTPEQQEAILLAVESGYFGVPRGATLDDIADELGISSQAASERVRRGADTVLRKVLLKRSAADFE
ncbi:helix-turn-helix domain-containing protein [Halobium salinum]|uniref:Helix-turn-helix domain-containing protein n=1 Tax=Halobium salinum TaxID=1364940 RepID=A0ABD5P9Z4_9EURY|nr:helix-turn-helix domain-containing protein [Halobium salinum]